MDLETEYNEKFAQLCNRISNNKYIFEITKLCGYGEFLTAYKTQSLLDLYNIISLQFDREIVEIFFLNNITHEKIKIPITSNIKIQDFIFNCNSGSQQIIKPIYPIPCKIVYRIYYDDGHTHGNKACELPIFI
jgi:hypothetical protein